MYQSCSSAGPPAGPQRPAAPKPVLTAARIMYVGAAVSAAELIGALPFMGGIHGKALGHRLTATPLTITVVIVVLLVPVALWLWMARAAGRGRNWARIVSTGAVHLGDAAADRKPGRRAGTHRRAGLAGRPGRGVAAVPPGRQRVLQAAALRMSSAAVFSAVPPRPGQDGGVRAASSRRGPSRRRHEDDPGVCSAAPGRIWT